MVNARPDTLTAIKTPTALLATLACHVTTTTNALMILGAVPLVVVVLAAASTLV